MTVSYSSSSSDSVIRLVANIFISFIGAGILGLPYAFKRAGLVEGTIIMASVCFLSIRAMLLLMDCKVKVEEQFHKSGGILLWPPPKEKCKRQQHVESPAADEDEMSEMAEEIALVYPKRNISYSDVAFVSFGPFGRLIVDSALLVSQLGFCCSYLIFISENLASFAEGWLDQHQWLVLLLAPLFLLTLVPDLNKLAMFSLLAQLSNLFAFTVVFWFDFEHLYLSSPENRKEFSLSGLPFFFSVSIYCFEGAAMILPLEASVQSSAKLGPHFRKYLIRTLSSVTVLYIAFGISGYLSYGEATKDIITLNLSSGGGMDFAAVVKACLCFSLFFTFPVMLFPVTTLMQERLRVNSKSVLYPYVFLRLAMVSATGLIVLVVPRFADLMALIGATCCTLLGFVMPGLCHLVICQRRGEKANTTINYTLVLIGTVGAVLGTHDALYNSDS